MIRGLVRLLGAVALLAGLVLLARDLLAFANGGGFRPAALGHLWSALDPDSFAATQRALPPALWDGAAVWLLLLPGFVVAALLGSLLLLFARPRRRQHGFR
jgi:hypothetical protein